MESITIISPLYVDLPRKTKQDKRCRLNLNEYRNWHYQVSNQAKSIYKEGIAKQLDGVSFDGPVNVCFKLYKGSTRRTDKSNFYSIQSKFLYDAMAELGCIEDDSDDYIKKEELLATEVDRENPRAEFVFTAAA
jgi:hypothetical protein